MITFISSFDLSNWCCSDRILDLVNIREEREGGGRRDGGGRGDACKQINKHGL